MPVLHLRTTVNVVVLFVLWVGERDVIDSWNIHLWTLFVKSIIEWIKMCLIAGRKMFFGFEVNFFSRLGEVILCSHSTIILSIYYSIPWVGTCTKRWKVSGYMWLWLISSQVSAKLLEIRRYIYLLAVSANPLQWGGGFSNVNPPVVSCVQSVPWAASHWHVHLLKQESHCGAPSSEKHCAFCKSCKRQK